MRLRLAVAVVVLLTVTAATTALGRDPVRSSIVRVYTTSQRPNYWRPWEMQAPQEATGSGCIIEGKRILTNAHVVADQTFLQVQRADLPDKYVASVAAVSHELDLALLTVEDEEFFDGTKPLQIGSLPEIGDRVVALGFPEGGTHLAVTEGVVSRIDRETYSHSWLENLVVQIDAPVNAGSSGGPVLSDGHIAGVAFQAGSGENIGYMVPAPVIEHFLEDTEDGRIDGTPILAVDWQSMENPQLRLHYGMSEDQSGVLLRDVAPPLEGEGKLHAHDVLLGIDDFDVANNGTIELRPGERIGLDHAIDRQQIGDSVVLHLLRDREAIDLELELSLAKQTYGYLVPRPRYDVRPAYFIYGGLLFAPLTTNYVVQWGDPDAVPPFLISFMEKRVTVIGSERQEIVLLSGVLPDELNAGYEGIDDHVVDAIDGQTVESLSHLVELLSSREGESHDIKLMATNYQIVLRHEDVDRRSQEILDRYRVPADRSPDLMAMRPSPSVDSTADVAAEVTPDEPPATSTSATSE